MHTIIACSILLGIEYTIIKELEIQIVHHKQPCDNMVALTSGERKVRVTANLLISNIKSDITIICNVR
jgi:hypothetical protein